MREMPEQWLVINVAGFFSAAHDLADLAYQLDDGVVWTSETRPKTMLLEEVRRSVSQLWRLKVKDGISISFLKAQGSDIGGPLKPPRYSSNRCA